MGVQCVKSTTKPKYLMDVDPNVTPFPFKSPEQKVKFCMRVSNISLCSQCQYGSRIIFKVENHFEMKFLESEIILHEKMIKWSTCRQVDFCITAKELKFLDLLVLILNRQNNIIQKLTLKLHLVCSGPKNHDHLLTQMKSRMIFDVEVGQKTQVKLNCTKFSCQDSAQSGIEEIGYSLGLVPRSERECTMVSNPEQKEEFTRQISINKLKESSVNVTIYEKGIGNCHFLRKNIVEIYIPFMKILKSDQVKIIQTEEETFELRKVYYQQKVQKRFQVQIQIDVQISKVYIQQMECLVYSQQGIKVGPSRFSDKLLFLQEDSAMQTWLQEFSKKLKTVKSITFENKITVEQLVKKGFQFFVENEKNQSQNQFLKVQFLLIEILNNLASFFTEGEDVINEHIWILIDKILHRPELSINYLTFIEEVKDRKELGVNFYVFICNVLSKIIVSVNIGLTYHELKCVQKFISYIYFRYPWIQSKIVQVLKDQEDPKLTEEKLMQIGAFSGSKSPSKTLAYDWQNCLYMHVKKEKKYLQAVEALEEIAKQIPEWAEVLFSRTDDDLYYGLFIEIWNEAQRFLNNQGRIMWEYFPYYGDLLETFLGQMNKNTIVEYSTQFHDCSIKLISNEKLLNSFILHLFPKTCLYETFCVIKCLEFINSYFEVLKKRNQTMPSDFNFLYFETGIKEVFKSSHSYLIIKVLTLLYEHYHLFSPQFQKQLGSFILYRNFYKLFLHWCSYARKMFYYFLQFRLVIPFKYSLEEKKNQKVSFELIEKRHRYQEVLQTLQSMQEEKQFEKHGVNERNTQQYYMRMKKKLQRKRRVKKTPEKFNQEERMKKFDEEHFPKKISETEDRNQEVSRVHRKWSTNYEIALIQDHVPESQKKYIEVAMFEYREIKKQQNPNEGVKKLLNLFRGDKDVKA